MKDFFFTAEFNSNKNHQFVQTHKIIQKNVQKDEYIKRVPT